MYSDLVIRLLQDSQVVNYKPLLRSIPSHFQYLRDKYLFGSDAMASNSHHKVRKEIFDIAIRPLLQFACNNNDVELYSLLDHLLFKTYICPSEDIDWFKHAFWDVNSYGLAIARSLRSRISLTYQENLTHSEKRLLFVFKGPFKLAHAGVLKDFLDHIIPDSSVDVHLLLLDHPPIEFENIKVHSFCNSNSTVQKLSLYMHLCRTNNYYNIIWVACVQNLSLFMGLSLSAHQTYWTMKRHSIIFPEVTRYATFISQHRNKIYNDVYWFGGRYRLNAKGAEINQSQILVKHGYKSNLVQDKFVYGSLTRDQKYQSLKYWKGIEYLLSKSSKSIFIYGASNLTNIVSKYIQESQILSHKTINFGWLEGKTTEVASLIQVYVDTIPFGSGLTAAECILAGGCYLGVLSDINKEASFTNILYDAINLCSDKKISYNTLIESLGIFSDFTSCIRYAEGLQGNKEKANKLHALQKKLLDNLNNIGEKCFSDDYLKYFLS